MTTLRQLLDDATAPDLALGGLCADSRRIERGEAFVACRGAAFDGHDFAADAVAAGAVAVLSERPVAVAVPNVVLPDLGGRVGCLATRMYGDPSAELPVVGVTGTNGKTTVAHMIASVAGGGYIGTIGAGRPPELASSALTTPDAITLQRQLRHFADDGAPLAAIEASSHALHQGRVDGVRFATGVFTNLSRDHLDYHGTVANYGAAKRRLFQGPLRAAVINVDDAFGRSLAQGLEAGVRQITYGHRGAVRWTDVTFARAGIEGTWHTPWGDAPFALPAAIGEFSLYNAAAALAACCAEAKPLADVVAAMRELPGIAGRMQRVWGEPAVIVDYAHTPDALRTSLAALRRHAGSGRVVVLFGCGGDRDRGKRPQMAAAAEAGADAVVVTSDNPRREPPDQILDDVMAGFARPGSVRRIADRREAIAAAIALAGPDDSVLLAGKGHETAQIVGDERLPFDDAAVARELLTGGTSMGSAEHPGRAA